MWWMWAVMGSISIVATEYMCRASIWEHYHQAFPYVIVPALMINGSIFYLYKYAPSYLLGWGLLFAGNIGGRMLVSYMTGEPLRIQSFIALSLIIGGVLILKLGETV